MEKRERVLAALRGERPDRVPVGFWGHDRMHESTARDLAEETLRRARTYDWDFVKVQSRSTCFAECWGARWRPPTTTIVRPVQEAPAVTGPADLDRLAASMPDYGPLAQQLEALRLIRSGLPDGRPVLMTVFSPLMVFAYCLPEQPTANAAALALLDGDRVRAARVLEAITVVIERFARECVAAGADGIFYASNLAASDVSTIEQLRRYQRPYDLRVLASVADAPFNVAHICGARPHFDEFADYPVACFSWAIGEGAPTLAAVRARTGKAVAGGISHGAALRDMSAGDVEREARAAIATTGGSGLLLAPGCAITADTPPENLIAVERAAASAR